MTAGNFLVRAIGFYNDAYDLFVMNIINVVLSTQYGHDVYSPAMKGFVSTGVFVGSVIGQLLFGYYADVLGRRRIMILTAILLIVGGLLCTFSYASNPVTLIYMMAISRCILGIGIGGEYPLSATVTCEGTSTKGRGKAVCSTFSMQGIGQLTAAIFGNLLIQTFANSPTEQYQKSHLEAIWRVLFGLGTLPALCIFYPRLKMEENHHFQRQVTSKTSLEDPMLLKAKRMETQNPVKKNLLNQHFPAVGSKLHFVLKYYGWRLFGTSMSWCLFDIIFYSQSIFSATIMANPAFGSSNLQHTSLKLVYLAFAALPGYFVAIATIDIIGRKNMQLQGFAMMTLLFSALGFCWTSITKNVPLFLTVYALTFFFSNFGPNTTTFLLPVESFPTALRATCHGFSAALGKAGATLGTALFSYVSSNFGIERVFLICAFIAFVCLPLTWFFIEDRQGDLSLLEDELNRFIQNEKSSNRMSSEEQSSDSQRQDESQAKDPRFNGRPISNSEIIPIENKSMIHSGKGVPKATRGYSCEFTEDVTQIVSPTEANLESPLNGRREMFTTPRGRQ